MQEELHDLGKRTIEKRKEYFADVVVKRRQHEAYLRHKNGLSGKVGRPKKT
jgi:hypothetical protein